MRCVVCLCMAMIVSGQTTNHGVDPDEGTLSSSKPRIPEPMVFDLVRPLGAPRNEVEVNSLFRVPIERGSTMLLWAPEIEVTLADGIGIEFEAPLHNQTLEGYKGAFQVTLPGSWKGRTIHGLQAIGEFERKRPRQHADLLYIGGVRLNKRWSTLSMVGARREKAELTGIAALSNHSLFFERTRSVTFGIETNWKGEAARPSSFLLMPQLHWRKTRLNVQMGAGLTRSSGLTSAVLGLRMSREF